MIMAIQIWTASILTAKAFVEEISDVNGAKYNLSTFTSTKVVGQGLYAASTPLTLVLLVIFARMWYLTCNATLDCINGSLAANVILELLVWDIITFASQIADNYASFIVLDKEIWPFVFKRL